MSVAAPATAPARRARPAPKRRPAPRPRPKARRIGLVGGVLSILVLAALLGGIVALNVAALQLNVRLDELDRRKAELRAHNAALSAQLSSAGSAPQVAALAERRLGLVSTPPEQTTYVDLRPRR